eukprot:7850178-Pyramimonas_sp.AAC.1
MIEGCKRCCVQDVMWDQNLVIDAFHEWVANKPITFRSCWIGFGKYDDEKHDKCFSDCCRSEHPFGLPPSDRPNQEGTMGWEIDRSLKPGYSHYKKTVRTLHNNSDAYDYELAGFRSRTTTLTSNVLGACGLESAVEHENQCCRSSHVGCGSKIGWMRERGCWDEGLTTLLSVEQQERLGPYLRI